jgi:arsenite-transporting ATPase
VLRAELAAEELVGLDRLRAFADALYPEVDPSTVLHEGQPMRLDVRDGRHVLALHLPFADKDELELGRRDDELLVRVGPHRRALLLPDSLKRRAVTGAEMVGDWLEITFDAEEGAAP